MGKRRNWNAITLEYVTSEDDVTLEVIAEKHGISYHTVKRQSARRKWSQEREKYRVGGAKRARRKLEQKLARKLVEQTERDLSRLAYAENLLLQAIQSGTLKASSLDTAISRLCQVIELRRQIMGEVADRHEVTGDKGGPIIVQFVRHGLSLPERGVREHAEGAGHRPLGIDRRRHAAGPADGAAPDADTCELAG